MHRSKRNQKKASTFDLKYIISERHSEKSDIYAKLCLSNHFRRVFPPSNIFIRQFRRQFLHEINLANLRKFATPDYTPGLSLFGMCKRIIWAFPKGPLIVQLERLSKAQQAPVTLPPHKHNELPKAGTKSYGIGHEPPPLLLYRKHSGPLLPPLLFPCCFADRVRESAFIVPEDRFPLFVTHNSQSSSPSSLLNAFRDTQRSFSVKQWEMQSLG